MATVKQMKYSKTIFARNEKGEKFVRIDFIMHPMIPFLDGLDVHLFGREKFGYLTVEDGIRWVQEEAKSHSKERYQVLEAILTQYRDNTEEGVFKFDRMRQVWKIPTV